MKAYLLHFFTNVLLAADAEAALEPYGLTRLHNRVLVLTAMNPGATISDLLRAMRVSHQNLNPTMRQLIKDGLLIARIGEEDRRRKQLYPTHSDRIESPSELIGGCRRAKYKNLTCPEVTGHASA